MATERVLSNLNLISFKTEGGLQNHIDELQDGDLVFTPDSSLKGVLFDFKWADHLLNDMSWLRADTFSWHDGEMYKVAYNHLVADFENAKVNHWYAWVEIGGGIWYTKTPTVAVGDTVYNSDFSVFGQVDTVYSETNFTIGANDFNRSASDDITVGDTEKIDGIEITYYRAEDGHKICLPDQEDKVLELYNKTGVAWYYILDTANKQLKLPRTKFGFTGLRDNVGNYVPESVPNIKGSFVPWCYGNGNTTGAFSNSGAGTNSSWGTQDVDGGTTISFDASDSASSYQDGAPVQQRATQMYLYFYVGNFERDAVEQTAGIAAEMFNSKADSDLRNIPSNYDYVVESQIPTEANGYTWYRKYKSGWVEQGGDIPLKTTSVTFPVEMADSNYICSIVFRSTTNSTNVTYNAAYTQTQTTTGFTCISSSSIHKSWKVSGRSAQ